MKGFVIGNGISRKGFDLEQLRDKGIIVGCNAIYREFSPDYVVFVDNAMGQELADNYPGTIVGQRAMAAGKSRRLVHKPGYRVGSRCSGGLAIDFAISRGCDDIYWIGFDNPKKATFNEASLYAKTKNYSRAGNWNYSSFITEYKEILTYYSTTQIYNVIREGVSNPMEDELDSFPNYSVITYDTLVAQLE